VSFRRSLKYHNTFCLVVLHHISRWQVDPRTLATDWRVVPVIYDVYNTVRHNQVFFLGGPTSGSFTSLGKSTTRNLSSPGNVRCDDMPLSSYITQGTHKLTRLQLPLPSFHQPRSRKTCSAGRFVCLFLKCCCRAP
jgi:hypothetical protein